MLDRSRTSHRMFRRLTGPRLEELLAEARASAPASAAPAAAAAMRARAPRPGRQPADGTALGNGPSAALAHQSHARPAAA